MTAGYTRLFVLFSPRKRTFSDANLLRQLNLRCIPERSILRFVQKIAHLIVVVELVELAVDLTGTRETMVNPEAVSDEQ